MANNTSKRGFASMDKERRRELGRKGGMSSKSGSRKSSQTADKSTSQRSSGSK